MHTGPAWWGGWHTLNALGRIWVTGEQGSEATADLGVAGIKVANPTPYTGDFTGNTGGPQITASFLGREKNLTTGAPSAFNPSKIFKLGATFFGGFELTFNGDKYSQLVAANAACRAVGGK